MSPGIQCTLSRKKATSISPASGNFFGFCQEPEHDCLLVAFKCFLPPPNKPNFGTTPLKHATALFMVEYTKLDSAAQHEKTMEWIRYSKFVTNPDPKKRHCQFIVPTLNDPDGKTDWCYSGPNVLVCQGAMHVITGKHCKYWVHCKRLVEQNLSPHHALAGREGNRSALFNRDVREPLTEFFEGIKEFGEPIATRFIRDHTGDIQASGQSYITMPISRAGTRYVTNEEARSDKWKGRPSYEHSTVGRNLIEIFSDSTHYLLMRSNSWRQHTITSVRSLFRDG